MLLLDGISSWLKFKLILYNLTDEWPTICQEGKKQSPIGVCKNSARSVSVSPLKFLYYKERYKGYVQNRGNTVEITIENLPRCKRPILKGGNLGSEYVLDSIQFHWESEHTIDGKRYPLEAQFFHYNRRHGNMENALNDPDGLVVLAVMFKVVECHNSKLENMVCATEEIATKIRKPKKIVGGVIVNDLLPNNKSMFYMYEGSKTYPDCSENVRWIIFEEILPIGQDQLDRLTSITSEEGEPVTKNNRPIQELNDRDVLYCVDTSDVKQMKEFIKISSCAN